MRPLASKNKGQAKAHSYRAILLFALALLPTLTACDNQVQPTPQPTLTSGLATPTAGTVGAIATTGPPTNKALSTPELVPPEGFVAATATGAASDSPDAPPSAVATLPAEPTLTPLARTPMSGTAQAATPLPAITRIAASTPTTVYNRVQPTVGPDILPIRRGRMGKREVAITFDAGGGSGNVPAILQALRQRGIHITFFLTGKWVADNPDAARAIAADGHDIGNHTYNHLHMAKVTDDNQVVQEVDNAETEIQSVTGIDPRPYFRFPYGESSQHLRQLVSSMGYTNVLWTLDSLDSVGQPKSAQFIIERVTHSRMNLDGAIILMHIGNMTSADALPTILDRLNAQGYRVVTITELLR